MATITVTTATDVVNAGDGVLSLREAVTQANATTGTNIIQFAPGLEGATLTLTGGELTLSRDVTIDGDANNDGVEVTISGGHLSQFGYEGSRIFNIVGDATDVRLNDLSLRDGFTLQGGGGTIQLGGGHLELTSCTIADSGYYAGAQAGGIFATAGSEITMVDSSIVNCYDGAIGTGDFVTLVIRDSLLANNSDTYGAGALDLGHNCTLVLEDSIIRDNGTALEGHTGGGPGGIFIASGSALIERSAIIDNDGAYDVGGISSGATTTISNSTVAGNSGDGGGGIHSSGDLVIRNSTVTDNRNVFGNISGIYRPGGIYATGTLDIANSIVAGNVDFSGIGAPDIEGMITRSNGHNVFGSEVEGNVAGDREGIAGSMLFAAVRASTGGGLANADGVVLLRNDVSNPALGAADRFAAMPFDQLGAARPQPAGTLTDAGAAELNHGLSTTASANNDVLIGTSVADTISGLAGNDRISGGAGNDTLNGNAGSDYFDAGPGNDKVNGGSGIDVLAFGGNTAVKFDLSGATDTATRGSEHDTLTGVEGAIGTSAADVFKGDNLDNWFMGGSGKDTFTGGAGRDLFDFNEVADSKVGAANRDVITDFAHLIDKIDVTGLDADGTDAGNQAFRWVGTAALAGPGEIGYFTTGGNTIIRASNDADATSEFEIQLTGIKTLTAADFYL